jgi:hypothetical protein
MRRLLAITGLLAIVLAALLTVRPTSGQTDVIVNNADATWTQGMQSSSGLGAVLDAVAVRVVQAHANANRNAALVNAPPALRTLLDRVLLRVYFDSANGARVQPLSALPTALRTAVDAMLMRNVVNGANGTGIRGLSYPKTLLNDQTPPSMDAPILQSAEVGWDLIWITNEFTTAIVRYGTTPGVYTQERTVALFAKTHSLPFTDLQAGVTYYFQFGLTDLAGNRRESQEYPLAISRSYHLFLPSIRR